MDCSTAAARTRDKPEKGMAVSGRAAVEGGTARQVEGGGSCEKGDGTRENMDAGASPFSVRGAEKNSEIVWHCAFEKIERMQRHALKMTVPVAFEC